MKQQILQLTNVSIYKLENCLPFPVAKITEKAVCRSVFWQRNFHVFREIKLYFLFFHGDIVITEQNTF